MAKRGFHRARESRYILFAAADPDDDPARQSRPGGVWVFSTDGKHLATFKIPEVVANLNWGDDGRTLYITASSSLYRVRLKIPGVRP